VNQILYAAELCNAVYSGSKPEGLGIQVCETIVDAATDTSGMAYITADTIWISFAGTEKRRDWLSNFKVIKKKCFGWFPAHKGFSECAEAVIKACLDLVNTFPERRVVVTGHSLGGAIAVLVAIGLHEKTRVMGARSISLITFGQPRVSTESLIRASFPGEYVRVQNGSDVVARVPKIGYSHAGTCLYLKNGKGYCVDPGVVETFLDRLPTIGQRCTDHFMPHYIRELQRIL
jgi:predicted lipase